jgi:hypothetical protein
MALLEEERNEGALSLLRAFTAFCHSFPFSSFCAGEPLLRALDAFQTERMAYRLVIYSATRVSVCVPCRANQRAVLSARRILDAIVPKLRAEEQNFDEVLDSTLENTCVLDISADPLPSPPEPVVSQRGTWRTAFSLGGCLRAQRPKEAHTNDIEGSGKTWTTPSTPCTRRPARSGACGGTRRCACA